jgi:hypothetical protein
MNMNKHKESNAMISSRKQLEAQIKNHSLNRKVTEARVSAACNDRIKQQDGQGVNGIYIDAIAVVVDEEQDVDLHCIALRGK